MQRAAVVKSQRKRIFSGVRCHDTQKEDWCLSLDGWHVGRQLVQLENRRHRLWLFQVAEIHKFAMSTGGPGDEADAEDEPDFSPAGGAPDDGKMNTGPAVVAAVTEVASSAAG